MNITKSKRISFQKRNIREVKFLLSIMLLMYCGTARSQDNLILLMEKANRVIVTNMVLLRFREGTRHEIN